MRWEQSAHLFALPLRSWHFASTLADGGHDVRLIALRKQVLDGWPVDKVTRVRRGGVVAYSVSEHACHELPELIWKIVDEHRPEAIVGVNTAAAAVAVNFVRQLPLWADINGDPMAEAQARAAVYHDDFCITDWYQRFARVLARADRFSTCSRRQQMALLGQLGLAGRLTGCNDGHDFTVAIPNSLDEEDIAALGALDRAPRSPTDPFIVLWSGGYNTWADVETLLAALELAMAEVPTLRFTSLGGSIAGHDDVTFGRFRELVAQSRFADRFEFPGWVLSEELPVYYRGAHAAISVDRHTVEGQLGARTRMLDWLAAGLPIVTTQLSEISEELGARGLALTAPCGQARALADALIKLAHDPALAADMAMRGRRYCRQQLRASVQLEPLVAWARAPARAPDADRAIDLRRATSPAFALRKSAWLVREQLRTTGAMQTLARGARFVSRKARSRVTMLAVRAGLDSTGLPDVPSADTANVPDIGPRFGPQHWHARASGYTAAPMVGVVMYAPRGTPPDVLGWTLTHVRRQYYGRWRLLVVAGRDLEPELLARARTCVAELRADGHEAELFDSPEAHSSSILQHQWAAATDYLTLLGPGDLLQPDALAELVDAALEHDADVVYADEAKVDETGAARPAFCKPAWSPDFLLSYPYIGQPALYRTALAAQCEGLALDAPARAIEYDLALRMTEKADEVHHIPRTLCRRWSFATVPVAQRVHEEQELAVAEHRALMRAVWRRGLDASVERGSRPHSFRIRRRIAGRPAVSIVIPTRDRLDLLGPCLASIESLTTYDNTEILIIDNGSTDEATLDYLRTCRHRVLRYDEPFNFSRLNNRAAREASGDALVLLNNDTRVITPDWIEAMLEHAQRPEVGAVGVKLLWPDGVIQHAGIAYMPTRFTYAHGRMRDAGQDAFTDVVRNWSAVTAACMMIRRDLYLRVGGLDEGFAIAYNDVDLCLRLRAQGYAIVYTPHAVLYHHESSSRGFGRQPRADDALLESRWLASLGPDPYLGAVGLRE